MFLGDCPGPQEKNVFGDKQFADIELFYGKKESPRPDAPQQLQLF